MENVLWNWVFIALNILYLQSQKPKMKYVSFQKTIYKLISSGYNTNTNVDAILFHEYFHIMLCICFN